jgi:hypothetical protein
MTLREFLAEIGVDVLEDTQGTLDLKLIIEEDFNSNLDELVIEKIVTNYEDETICVRVI